MNIGITCIVFALLFGLNMGFFIYQSLHPSKFFIYINDADRLPNGNTAIRLGDYLTTIKIATGHERANCYSAIIEVNPNGDIVWQYSPSDPAHTHIDHEIKKREFKGRTGYFFTDCLSDSIKFVDRELKQITWEYWLGGINWTEVNPSWGEDHYYNQPDIKDWSHLNDIDFYNYTTWESMLLSIRDFDLIVEVNLTSAQEREQAQASDIVWYYGGENILACPHNPDYLPNGNIIIVDSDHLRIIEVNMTTKKIVWEWTNNDVMTWPRDCDLMPDGEHFLITDADETFILDNITGEVGLRIDFGGYEADYVEASNTITVGGDTAGMVKEFDASTGEEVWRYGEGGMEQILTVNLIILIIFELYLIMVIYIKSRSQKLLKSFWGWAKIFLIFVVIALEAFLLFGYKTINVFFFVHTIC